MPESIEYPVKIQTPATDKATQTAKRRPVTVAAVKQAEIKVQKLKTSQGLPPAERGK